MVYGASHLGSSLYFHENMLIKMSSPGRISWTCISRGVG